MPLYLENLNLGFFRESEDAFGSLMGLTASEGKGIVGYYNLPYLNKHLGSAQIVLRTGFREQAMRLMDVASKVRESIPILPDVVSGR